MEKTKKILVTALLLILIVTGVLYAQEQAEDSSTGNSAGAGAADLPLFAVNIQVVPGLNIFGHNRSSNIFLLGFVVGKGYGLNGLGTASFGLINTGTVRGVQFSGVFNTISGDLMGVQAASLFNIVTGTPMGAMLAGSFNWAKNDAKGFQFAGMVNNVSQTLMGIQIAGLFNYANEIRGVQVGPVNKTKNGYGIQVGLINISDSDFIIPIGLINFVRKGIKRPTVYADDFGFLNFGYRSGGKYFYSHSMTGIGRGYFSRDDDSRLLSFRSGHGFEIPIDNFFVTFDFTTGKIIKLDKLLDYFFGPATSIYQFRLTGGYNIFKHLGVFVGISLDILTMDKNDSPNPLDFTGAIAGRWDGRTMVKFGFFGGLQF